MASTSFPDLWITPFKYGMLRLVCQLASLFAYSPDHGLHIISGSTDKTIRIWDGIAGTATGKLLKGHTASVRSVAHSPDGWHIISDGTIQIWNAETGIAVGKPLEGVIGYVLCIACSLNGYNDSFQFNFDNVHAFYRPDRCQPCILELASRTRYGV